MMSAAKARRTEATPPTSYSGSGNYRTHRADNRRTRQPRRRNSEVRRAQAKQWRARKIMDYGMRDKVCWFLTIVNGHCLDTGIRANIWHPLRTSFRRTFRGAAACTILEWGMRRGIHLHVIIVDAPKFSREWIESALARIHPGAECICKPVYDAPGLAEYLSKQIAEQTVARGWPRHTRPFTKTTNWPMPPELKRKRRSGQERA